MGTICKILFVHFPPHILLCKFLQCVSCFHFNYIENIYRLKMLFRHPTFLSNELYKAPCPRGGQILRRLTTAGGTQRMRNRLNGTHGHVLCEPNHLMIYLSNILNILLRNFCKKISKLPKYCSVLSQTVSDWH